MKYKYLKEYSNFEYKYSDLLSNSEYFDYLEDLKTNTDWDDERAKEDLDYYLDIVGNLIKNGGQIYRIVWLFSESDLNDDDLGEHWTIDPDFGNFYGNLENEEEDDDGNTSKPYLIIAKIEPNNINLDDSLSYYTELPNELEINIINQPIEYKIIEFDRYKNYSYLQ